MLRRLLRASARLWALSARAAGIGAKLCIITSWIIVECVQTGLSSYMHTTVKSLRTLTTISSQNDTLMRSKWGA